MAVAGGIGIAIAAAVGVDPDPGPETGWKGDTR